MNLIQKTFSSVVLALLLLSVVPMHAAEGDVVINFTQIAQSARELPGRAAAAVAQHADSAKTLVVQNVDALKAIATQKTHAAQDAANRFGSAVAHVAQKASNAVCAVPARIINAVGDLSLRTAAGIKNVGSTLAAHADKLTDKITAKHAQVMAKVTTENVKQFLAEHKLALGLGAAAAVVVPVAAYKAKQKWNKMYNWEKAEIKMRLGALTLFVVGFGTYCKLISMALHPR